MARERTAIGAVSVTALAGTLLFTAGDAGAVDFIRGDSNGDGSVSIADAYHIVGAIFHG